MSEGGGFVPIPLPDVDIDRGNPLWDWGALFRDRDYNKGQTEGIAAGISRAIEQAGTLSVLSDEALAWAIDQYDETKRAAQAKPVAPLSDLLFERAVRTGQAVRPGQQSPGWQPELAQYTPPEMTQTRPPSVRTLEPSEQPSGTAPPRQATAIPLPSAEAVLAAGEAILRALGLYRLLRDALSPHDTLGQGEAQWPPWPITRPGGKQVPTVYSLSGGSGAEGGYSGYGPGFDLGDVLQFITRLGPAVSSPTVPAPGSMAYTNTGAGRSMPVDGTAACGAAFHQTPCGNFTAQTHARVAPNGRMEWFTPRGKPKTFSKDRQMVRELKKEARRLSAICNGGGR